MKLPLHELLKGDDAGVSALNACIGQCGGRPGSALSEEQFVARVTAAMVLAGRNAKTDAPASLAALVRMAVKARGCDEKQVRTAAGICAAVWKQVMTARVPPYLLSPRQWADLGKALSVGYTALESAVTGSYRQYAVHAAAGHPKFARSKVKRNVPAGYTAELADAFGELRTKSAARRMVGGADEKLDAFLGEIRRCMSGD